MSILDILYTVLIMPLQLAFEALYVISNNFIQNPGLSIIALSLMMNFLVLPLYMRADAMQEHERDMEAKLREGIKHIKSTFSGDERMMMTQTYYRQNDYRPTDVFKGSISLFLEIPFFISAYLFLSNCQIIQGVSFGPIADLGSPDGLITIGSMSINLLPFIMTGFNLVSCALFTKGMPVKMKVQLYGMAAFFLVFLYGSPAGLVFYWTLNNVFALIKTIFYKLKNPKLVLKALFAVAGVALVMAGPLAYGGVSVKRTALLVVLGICCMLPMISTLLSSKLSKKPPLPKWLKEPKPSKRLFITCALFLTVLIGFLIPSAVIASSPQEFFDVRAYSNPLWLVISSGCLAAGTFLVWFGVFYWLCNDRAKVIFQTAMAAACGIAVINYMAFGTNLGLITSGLQYENGLYFSTSEITLNLTLFLILVIAIVALAGRFQKPTARISAVMAVVLCAMGCLNVATINSSVADAKPAIQQAQTAKPSFTLSKTKQNVVVIMLDRAIGPYIPYLLNEKPELQEKLSGFTYYGNTLSYGEYTISASAALYGGYEYTPTAMNQRDTVSMKDKQNEALRVMPVTFDEAGYDVTVFDPPYANYTWIPDTSIYNDHPNINAMNAEGYFANSSQSTVESNKRNFFCFALMKTMPLAFQPTLYSGGTYNTSKTKIEETSTQVYSYDGLSSSGILTAFYNAYTNLQNMDKMTEIEEDGPGGFLMMCNNTTHEPSLLQEPAYEPSYTVDNSQYEAQHADRFTLNGTTLAMDTIFQKIHYQTNMAALLKLADWFDYLRENDVYDNTRIILVSDHARILHHNEDWLIDVGETLGEGHEDGTWDIMSFMPLLMVKDFNAQGFSTSEEFMTNADTPTLAFNGVIANPKNPATGNAISSEAKAASKQDVISVSDWQTNSLLSRTTFLDDSVWLTFQGTDVKNRDNWTVEGTR